jgi:hypothetical protein
MEWWKPVREDVSKSLLARRVRWETINLFYRRDSQDEPSEDDLTIFIGAHHNASSNSWLLVLGDVYKILQKKDLSVRVEIMDRLYARAPLHYIVESSHPLIPKWPTISTRIAEMLGSRPWLTLTAIRRGRHRNPKDNPVVVLITTPDPPSLRPLVEDIKMICRRSGFALEVELLREKSIFGMSRPCTQNSDFIDPIPMGTSISACSVQDHAGTMGGAIEVRMGTMCVRVGVTSYHVFQTPGTKSKQ